MKKILIILLLTLSTWAFAEYDSTYVLAIKQKFAIPEDVENGDYLDYWIINRTWMKGAESSATFEITTNFNNAFAINASTGLLTVADYTQINGKIVQQDTIINLIIKSTESGFIEYDTAEVHVKEASFCRFYSNSGTSTTADTTRSSPHDVLVLADVKAGFGIFLKRGDVWDNPQLALVGLIASGTNPTVFGSYGTGARAAFKRTTGTDPAFKIGGNWDADSAANKCFYMDLYALDFRLFYGAACYVTRPSNYVGWYGCNFNNCNTDKTGEASLVIRNEFPDFGSVGDSSLTLDFDIWNCSFDTTSNSDVVGADKSFMKTGATVRVYNCHFGLIDDTDYNEGQGVRFTAGRCQHIKHCDITLGITSGIGSRTNIQLRADYVTIEDCIINGGASGMYFTNVGSHEETYPDHVTVKNCWIYNTDVATIYCYKSNTSSVYSSRYNVVENNLLSSDANAMILEDWEESDIRYNTIYGSTGGITTSYDFDNNDIYYNIFYDNSGNDIYLTVGDGSEIYNNTVDGVINCTDASSEIARNNFYTSITSVETNSNGIDLDDITPAVYFTDYAGHDYSLKETAVLAIDLGYDWEQTRDILGNTKLGDEWDIGAYELQDEEDPTVTCIDDPTKSADEGQCYYTVVGTEFDTVSSSDNVGVVSVINDFNDLTTLAGEQIPDGTTIEWMVTDAASNTGTCSFTVTVTDDEDPTIGCIENQTKDADEGESYYTVVEDEFDPTATGDNCGVASTLNDFNDEGTLAGAQIPDGTTITWTITDESSNTNDCSFTVTVTVEEEETTSYGHADRVPRPVTRK